MKRNTVYVLGFVIVVQIALMWSKVDPWSAKRFRSKPTPSVTAQKAVKQACNREHGSGAIVTVADEGARKLYRAAIRSMECYGKKHGYPVLVLDPSQASPECSQYGDFMFKRHCMVLEELVKFDWVAAFDGDVGVVDSEKCLESLLTAGIDVVHEERFHNGEVQAGNYIVRNTEFGRQYLKAWMAYDKDLTTTFHNSDNGALHVHLLKYLAVNNTGAVDKCYGMWKSSHNLDTYDQYVGCVMEFASDEERLRDGPGKIRLIRRGHGFVRDLWVTAGDTVSPVDFLVHAMKEHVKFYDDAREAEDRCGTADYIPAILPGRMLGESEMRRVMARADHAATRDRPKSIKERAIISHCWPKCEEYWGKERLT